MEEDIRNLLKSSSERQTASSMKIEQRLQEAIEAANYTHAYESAHDEELLRALGVVAAFIKKKKRVCYGGTAMNAILPSNKQFYDPQTDLPDYDFYTPALTEDVDELVSDLKEAGYKDVHHRVGIHEGTKKILVNFVAVADISKIEPELFSIFYRRSIEKDGIHYTDPDILRMMMYLELSRPRGQVDRWEKVYERLQLINQEFPVGEAAPGAASRRHVPLEVRSSILSYIIEQQRILCNGPLTGLYTKGIKQGNVKFEIREGGPILFVSPDPKEDAKYLKKILKEITGKGFSLFLHKARGEIVPERIELRIGDTPVCMAVKEVACHAYNNFTLNDGRQISVASLEFLVTLYLSLHIFTTGVHITPYIGAKPLALVKEFISLATQNTKATNSMFPPFILSCRGHQTGYVSLIRQKVLRIQRERAAAAAAAAAGSTRKAKKGKGKAKAKAKKGTKRKKRVN